MFVEQFARSYVGSTSVEALSFYGGLIGIVPLLKSLTDCAHCESMCMRRNCVCMHSIM